MPETFHAIFFGSLLVFLCLFFLFKPTTAYGKNCRSMCSEKVNNNRGNPSAHALVSPGLALPRLASPPLASPRLASSRPALPPLASPRPAFVASPRLAYCSLLIWFSSFHWRQQKSRWCLFTRHSCLFLKLLFIMTPFPLQGHYSFLLSLYR